MSVVTRMKILSHQAESEELAEYTQNMAWLAVCRKGFYEWYNNKRKYKSLTDDGRKVCMQQCAKESWCFICRVLTMFFIIRPCHHSHNVGHSYVNYYLYVISHTHTHARTHAQTHTCACTHTHAHTCTRTHTPTRTRTQSGAW